MKNISDISLTVNGEERNAKVGGCDTLLTVMRDQFLLTGTKRGCNQGVCGACTLLVNGNPVRGCLSLATLHDGDQIITVEGLADDETLAPIQQAFSELGAIQCGFCTSGMMITAHAFLSGNSDPTIEEVRHGLSGNLCRCSGYKKIIDAVLEAAKLSSDMKDST